MKTSTSATPTAKNVELMQKIRALAEQGFGGEKENAQRILSRLMKKYGVETADLTDEIPSDHSFAYHTPEEKQLLAQLVNKIAGDRTLFKYLAGRGSRTQLFCRCTKAEAVQIEVEYEFYRQLWAEEREWLFTAFIQKHRIYDTKPGHPVTEMNFADYMRLAKMMSALKNATPLKQIEGGGTK